MLNESIETDRLKSPPVVQSGTTALVPELAEFFLENEAHFPWSQSYPTLQSGVQVCEQHPDDLLLSCRPGRELTIPEEDFNLLHPMYHGTVVERLLAELPMRLTRLRWMKLMPKSCYSLHIDPNPRVHVPVITNPDAYFAFFEEGFFHLPVGGVYSVDTTRRHTFMNGSEQFRVHLVGVSI